MNFSPIHETTERASGLIQPNSLHMYILLLILGNIRQEWTYSDNQSGQIILLVRENATFDPPSAPYDIR